MKASSKVATKFNFKITTLRNHEKTNFTETQILAIVAEAESGRKIHDICREHGITQATFYNWRKKYAGMQPNQLKRLKELVAELTQFKRMYADIAQ